MAVVARRLWLSRMVIFMLLIGSSTEKGELGMMNFTVMSRIHLGISQFVKLRRSVLKCISLMKSGVLG